MDTLQLREILSEVIGEHFSMHTAHHEWIQARIDAEEKRTQMYDDVRKTAIQWSVTALLGGLFFWLSGHVKVWF